MEAKRGRCSRCGFSVRLRRDGTPQRHRLYSGGRGWVYCDEAWFLSSYIPTKTGKRA